MKYDLYFYINLTNQSQMLLTKVARQNFIPTFRYTFASAAAATDYYKLLGIGRESTSEQIH